MTKTLETLDEMIEFLEADLEALRMTLDQMDANHMYGHVEIIGAIAKKSQELEVLKRFRKEIAK